MLRPQASEILKALYHMHIDLTDEADLWLAPLSVNIEFSYEVAHLLTAVPVERYGLRRF